MEIALEMNLKELREAQNQLQELERLSKIPEAQRCLAELEKMPDHRFSQDEADDDLHEARAEKLLWEAPFTNF